MNDSSKSDIEKEKIRNIRISSFTNDFDIRTKVPELVEYYLENEEFPKLLVVCNETDYGIEYAKFFYELEKLIITEGKIKLTKH